MLEITSDTTEKYITSENQTVQYTAKVYKSITTEKDKSEIVSKEVRIQRQISLIR